MQRDTFQYEDSRIKRSEAHFQACDIISVEWENILRIRVLCEDRSFSGFTDNFEIFFHF